MTLEVTPEEAARLEELKHPQQLRNQIYTEGRLRKLYEVHNNHPEYTRQDLRMATGFSRPMVSKYWGLFVKYPVQVIKAWDEVMP